MGLCRDVEREHNAALQWQWQCAAVPVTVATDDQPWSLQAMQAQQQLWQLEGGGSSVTVAAAEEEKQDDEVEEIEGEEEEEEEYFGEEKAVEDVKDDEGVEVNQEEEKVEQEEEEGKDEEVEVNQEEEKVDEEEGVISITTVQKKVLPMPRAVPKKRPLPRPWWKHGDS